MIIRVLRCALLISSIAGCYAIGNQQGEMMKLGLYRHYKGNLYHVIAVARHSETLEEMVVYQSLYGDYGVWVRPRGMFEGDMEVDGVTVSRFTFVRSALDEAPGFRK